MLWAVCSTLVVLLPVFLPASCALSAYDCNDRLRSRTGEHEADATGGCAADKMCGPFPDTSSRSFFSRLSPQCAELFESYRSEWSRAGISNILSARNHHVCMYNRVTREDHRRPMLINSEITPPFVACTVAKGGSTNMRVLLHNTALHPHLPTNNRWLQYTQAHEWGYPGLWHYDFGGRSGAESSTDASKQHPWSPLRLPPGVPSFVFSRNPYVRLLSGYRDKMAKPARSDTMWRHELNLYLGHSGEMLWEDTPEGFRQFVYELYDRGLESVNYHFQTSVGHCDMPPNLHFDFYMRMEELSEWFPCWMDGLGLRELTERGWGDVPHGHMYVGTATEEVFVTTQRVGGEWPEWDAAAGAATVGEEGVDWEWVKGDKCWWTPTGVPCSDYYARFTVNDTVVPGPDAAEVERMKLAGDDVGRRADEHDTGSDSRLHEFYDQETADLAFSLYNVDFRVFRYERMVLDEAA